MIERIVIDNLGVIDHAELELPAGMLALTGETGAGKTMALTSVGLLLGAKADTTKVRRGAEAATVEGTFVFPDDAPILTRVEEAGGSWEVYDGRAYVIVTRVVPANGRSRAFVGGRAVPQAVLTDIANEAVTVHGQSDQLRLISPAQQRAALDEFAHATDVQAAYTAAYTAHARAVAALEEFLEEQRQAARLRLGYEALVEAVDAVNPEIGEEARLKAEAQQLQSLEANREKYVKASALLEGAGVSSSDSAVAAVARAARYIGESDEELAQLLETAESALSEAVNVIGARIAHADGDPARLDAIFSRQSELAGLRKSLGMDLDYAIEQAATARAFLERIADGDGTRARLEAERDAALAALKAAAKDLHRVRTAAAKDLEKAVTAEVRGLAMPEAVFTVSVEALEEYAPHGADAVSFSLTSSPALPAVPLGKGASGGELSRVMLAVEVTLAQRVVSPYHTFIFDEVDAGIGGKAAIAVGQRLRELGKHCQVVVVTHLAQVAAHAHSHSVVRKDVGSGTTHLAQVVSESRETELARMLSGQEDSAAARLHAAELLTEASMG